MIKASRYVRADIQALRAIAVLAVVVYHLWPDLLIGGFMGVDIFFVISGFLMTITLTRATGSVLAAKKKFRATGEYLVNFYARRIARLVPAASLALLGTLGLVILTGSYVTIIDSTRQIIASAAFFQNWLLAGDAVDYLASTADPTALQHFWTLSLEEQFYLVWPLLLLTIFLSIPAFATILKKTKIHPALIPILLLTVGFFIYGYYLTQTNPAAAYFVTPARVWELLMGGVVAFLPKLKNHNFKLWLPWAGLALCVYAMLRWGGDGFPGWHALVPTIGTALIIYGGTEALKSKHSFNNRFRVGIIQRIGDMSYSLYLWHWPLIILLPMILAINISSSEGELLKFAVFGLSLLMAWFSYKFVEIPAQKLNLKKRYVYLGFVILLSLVVGSAYLTKRITVKTVDAQLATLHSLVKSTSKDRCIGGKWLMDKAQCGNGFGKVNPNFAQFTSVDNFRKIIDGRWCRFYDYRAEAWDNPRYSCVIGDSSSSYQIAVFGDSHTNHWINALHEIGVRNHIRFVTMDNHVCGSNEVQEPQCENRLLTLKKLGVFDKSKYVILSHLHRSDSTLDNKFGNIGLTVAAISDITDTPIYLLEDTPPASQFIGGDCVLYKLTCTQEVDDVTKSIKTISDNVVNAGILDRDRIIRTYDMFCDDRYCYSFIGGLSVYSNAGRGKNKVVNSHMTGSFSLSLALPLEEKLREHGLLPR